MHESSHAALSGAPRVGIGTDLHRLEEGRPCVLGSIHFADCPLGPAGHSDGDAVLHALCDALLGAAGLDDLGSLFPDDAEVNRDRASSDFVREAMRQLTSKELRVASVDLVIQCDRPRISPRRAEMREALAALLELPADRVNVKGKTFEGTRSSEVVAVQAVALLVSR